MVEPTSSLTAHLRPLAAGAPAVAAAFLGGEPALALADGIVVIGDPAPSGASSPTPTARSSSRRATATRLLTGGDDGRVVRTAADGGASRSPTKRAAGSTR